jgi:hypothetical protein
VRGSEAERRSEILRANAFSSQLLFSVDAIDSMSDNSPHIQTQPQDPAALQQLLQAVALAAGVSPSSGPSSAPLYPQFNHPQSSGFYHPALPQYTQPAPAYPSWSQPNYNAPFTASKLQISPAQASIPQSDGKHASQPVSTAEEKRRRNTEASARFRVKKKLKTVHLQRTVDDLVGRAEDLEREAAELRKENSWLKEIVMLKGRNISTDAIPSFNITFKPPDSFRSTRESSKTEGDEVDRAEVDADEEPEEKDPRPSRGKRRAEV